MTHAHPAWSLAAHWRALIGTCRGGRRPRRGHHADRNRLDPAQPLFDIMVPEYTKTHPGVADHHRRHRLRGRQQQALSGQVHDRRVGRLSCPTRRCADNPDFMNIPLAISAQTINYNVPGLNTTNLQLDGPTIAGIYTGPIRHGTRRRSPHSIPA